MQKHFNIQHKVYNREGNQVGFWFGCSENADCLHSLWYVTGKKKNSLHISTLF